MSKNHFLEVNRFAFLPEQLEEIGRNAYAQSFWPLVYVLSDNGRGIAYVGETADAVSRMSAHLKHIEKSRLKVAHLISSDKFNKSATLDIESNLIRYMSADGKFVLLNGNLGLVDHNYYQKEVYAEIFREVWDSLRREGLAEHSLEYITNSDLFKYSPYKSLSFDQRQGLLAIMYSLLDDATRNLVIEGGAGTGKSILAIFLFKLLQASSEDVNFKEFSDEELELRGLLTALKEKFGKPSMALVVPMTSFRNTLKKAFTHISGLTADMVIGPSELALRSYDIVVVDESHRLRRRVNLGAYFGAFDKASTRLGIDRFTCSEVQWVLKQSTKAIFFYDANQSIKPSDASAADFSNLKAAHDTQVHALISQFRARGGNSYSSFVDALLNNRLSERETFQSKNYECALFISIEKFVNVIQEKERQFGLSRMIAGYSWPWISKNEASAFDIEIEGKHLRWNSTNTDWINTRNSVAEVGCIHTTQGYDLNYSGIIFGREIGYDTARGEIFVRKELYFDRNGKQSIADAAELQQYILNIYKTIMLRGIRGTFVYACDPDLRDYLAQHIPVHGDSSVHTAEIIPIMPMPYVNAVPLYDLQAAAGSFSELQQVEQREWQLVPEHLRLREGMFACRVVGESMNRIIPNGALCLFSVERGGSRNGKIVLVEHVDLMDADSGSHFTVKEYQSLKHETEEGWTHTQIQLLPQSEDLRFEPIVLDEDVGSQYRIVGVFECVLAHGER